MEDSKQEALDFLHKHVKDLEALITQANITAANVVLAKERFHKWKKYVIEAIREKIGEGHAKQLSAAWLETTFAGGDIAEELNDDIEMCLRNLRKLTKNVETHGFEDPESTEHT